LEKEAGFGSPFSIRALVHGEHCFRAVLARYRIGTMRQKFSLATPAVSE